jgi:allantoinase
VSDERIVSVHPSDHGAQPSAGATTRIDMGKAFLLPGVIDSHVHSLSHAGEGVQAATRSAAAGGVTTIVEMPFDSSGPINTVDRFKRKQDLVYDEAAVDVALLATLEPGGGWRRADDIVAAGATGFKVSLFNTDVRRFPRIDDAELLEVMAAVANTGKTLCTHAENNEIVQSLLAKERAENPTDAYAHSRSRPPIAETLGVLTALEVAAETGAALHVCHLSLPRSVDLVRWYQEQGADVTLETCPHYLTLTEQDFLEQHGQLKINPPLRTQDDQDALWSRLIDGSINIVSSDHAPWSKDMKSHDAIFDNHSGIPGVETLVSLTLGRALQLDATLEAFGRAVDALTITPAQRFGLHHRKGRLAVGFDADLIAFSTDPDDSSPIDEAALHSNAGWSPYHGRTPGGRVTLTMSRGTVVYDSSAGLTAKPGRGELL